MEDDLIKLYKNEGFSVEEYKKSSKEIAKELTTEQKSRFPIVFIKDLAYYLRRRKYDR